MTRRAHEAGRWVSLHVVLTGRALAQQLTCSSQASPCPARGEGRRRARKPAAPSSLTRSPRHLPGLPGGRTEGPTRSRAPYMSVRCRRADSSLGTAVKWFPSRYLEERCRVTPGKGHGAHCRLLRAPSLAFRTRPGPRSRPSQRRCPLHGTHCACQLMLFV